MGRFTEVTPGDPTVPPGNRRFRRPRAREIRYWSPANPWACAAPMCAHLPAAHEDGKGGLGPCWGWPASERRWWRRRGCDCAGYVPQEAADRG